MPVAARPDDGRAARARRCFRNVGRRPRGEEVLRVEGLSLEGTFKDEVSLAPAGEIVGMAGLVGRGPLGDCPSLFGMTRPTAGAYS